MRSQSRIFLSRDLVKSLFACLIGMTAAFLCSIANAQMIYSNSFIGGAVTLNGAAPTVAANLAGGSSSALWSLTLDDDDNFLANGTIDGYAGSALLPFTPQPGCIYTMTASIDVGANTGGAWLCMGFTQDGPVDQNTNLSRFVDTDVNGYAWMVFHVGTTELFQGPGAAEPNSTGDAMPTTGTYTVQVVLNTTGTQWTASGYVNGVLAGTNVFSSNPPIGFAGIGQSSLANLSSDIQWYNWSLSVTQVQAVTTNYWVAPAASGPGNGSSTLSAAYYLNPAFWTNVQGRLQTENVNVNFVNGNYNAGSLNMTNMGNPLHPLTLTAATPYGPVFSPSANILQLYGCQNFQINGLVFNGPSPYWGIYCIPNNSYPCRNICINNCQFLNLTNATYAAIGLLNGTRDIQVLNCTFTNITNGAHEHMIYAPHDIEDVVVSNCVFQDCLADYVRFRDDSEYCVVENCTFISTKSATAWPFVSAELYNETNSDSAGDEFFGTYFQVSSNSFIYKASGGSGPYSGLHFSDTGFSPYTYDCDLTPTQEGLLKNGATSFQQSFLQTNMGIIASGIKMFGNTYSGATYQMDYQYIWNDTNAPYGGWQGTIGLNNVPDSSGALLAPLPGFRNGNFDRQGMLLSPISPGDDDYQCLFRDWFCSPKYTDILWTPGFNGTSNALRFDGTKSQEVYQWISNPGTTWTMDCLFAIGSAFSGTGTKFKVDLFHNDLTGAKVSMGVNNLGQFGIYNGGTFTVLPQLGTVAFSVTNSNGNFTEPGATLNVYRLRIVGNYAAGTPYVDIYTSDANSMNLDHQALNQTDWVGTPPVSGQSAPKTVAFYNYTAPVLLDQVAIAPGLGEQPPVISNFSSSSGNLILSGTNGFPGDTYYLLMSTNLASPGSWTLESSNTFGTNGAFSVTNSLPPGAPQEFYRLQLQ